MTTEAVTTKQNQWIQVIFHAKKKKYGYQQQMY